MEFLDNPWIVGIGGGVVSGLLVTFISRKFFASRDQREYTQKVIGANREVVYALRPGISEGLVPTEEVLNALVGATARKFSVDQNDLYQPPEIAQELIKEVMDSSFISSGTKEDYCIRLSALTKQKPTPALDKAGGTAEATDPERPSRLDEYRSRMVTMMSMMMGFVVMTMTVAFAFMMKGSLFLEFPMDSKENLAIIIIPVFLTMLAALMSMIMMSLIRDKRGRSEWRDPEIERKTAKPKEELVSPSPNGRGTDV